MKNASINMIFSRKQKCLNTSFLNKSCLSSMSCWFEKGLQQKAGMAEVAAIHRPTMYFEEWSHTARIRAMSMHFIRTLLAMGAIFFMTACAPNTDTPPQSLIQSSEWRKSAVGNSSRQQANHLHERSFITPR